MSAITVKRGEYFYPAMQYPTGRIVVFEGPPHLNRKTAMKYARLHIADLQKGR